MNDIPGYWPNEISGVLRPAVEAYLRGDEMTLQHIAAMRAYLRQWIMVPGWEMGSPTAELIDLRERINNLTSREAINDWLSDALDIGIDPL